VVSGVDVDTAGRKRMAVLNDNINRSSGLLVVTSPADFTTNNNNNNNNNNTLFGITGLFQEDNQ